MLEYDKKPNRYTPACLNAHVCWNSDNLKSLILQVAFLGSTLSSASIQQLHGGPEDLSRRFDLGDAAPQANGVKVYPMDNSQEEIMIEVDFSWEGNQDVQLTMKPIPKHLGPFTPAGAILSSIIKLRVYP